MERQAAEESFRRISITLLTAKEAGFFIDGMALRTKAAQFKTLLQVKGFTVLLRQGYGGQGGVPLNTERTTVKPWVGIAR